MICCLVVLDLVIVAARAGSLGRPVLLCLFGLLFKCGLALMWKRLGLHAFAVALLLVAVLGVAPLTSLGIAVVLAAAHARCALTDMVSSFLCFSYDGFPTICTCHRTGMARTPQDAFDAVDHFEVQGMSQRTVLLDFGSSTNADRHEPDHSSVSCTDRTVDCRDQRIKHRSPSCVGHCILRGSLC